MIAHVVTLQPPYDGTAIFICCSCSDEPIAKVGFPEAPASLVEINHIVHEHIEAAEREDSYRELTRRAVVKWGPMSRAHAEAIRPAPYEPLCTCSGKAGTMPHAAWCAAHGETTWATEPVDITGLEPTGPNPKMVELLRKARGTIEHR